MNIIWNNTLGNKWDIVGFIPAGEYTIDKFEIDVFGSKVLFRTILPYRLNEIQLNSTITIIVKKDEVRRFLTEKMERQNRDLNRTLKLLQKSIHAIKITVDEKRIDDTVETYLTNVEFVV